MSEEEKFYLEDDETAIIIDNEGEISLAVPNLDANRALNLDKGESDHSIYIGFIYYRILNDPAILPLIDKYSEEFDAMLDDVEGDD